MTKIFVQDGAHTPLNFWLKHPEYCIALNIITIFPGSKLYWKAPERGIIKDPVQYLPGCPQSTITKMTKADFFDIIEKCMTFPYLKTRTLEKNTVVSVDYDSARVSLQGTYSVCGKEKIWHKAV